jgi:hypothetical protein
MVPHAVFAQPGSKPNSVFNGVTIGAITYSWRSMLSSADDLLNYCIECGQSSVELMYGQAEEFAGAPTFERIRITRGKKVTDEMRTQMQAARENRPRS